MNAQNVHFSGLPKKEKNDTLANMNGIQKCKCGCETSIPLFDKKNRPIYYVLGHARKGKIGIILNPNSKSKRTSRFRARKLINTSKCYLYNKKFCSPRIEVHHKDGDPFNNDLSNLVAVCTTHHRFLESERITLENCKLPDFFISSNKRRYLWKKK